MDELKLSARAGRIKQSPTTAAAELAQQLRAAGAPVISLTTGEPDFDTPGDIIDAAHRAMLSGQTRYTATGGTRALSDAIRAKFQRDNGLGFDADEVMASAGAKQVVAIALSALVQTGDTVLIPTPAWVSYVDMTKLADGSPICIECPRQDGFKLTPGRLREHLSPASKVLILNAPCNPTGAVYSAAELCALADVLREYPHVTIISDDIYEHITYDNIEFSTMAQVAPDLRGRILTVNGVSKAYAMTGWRIGIAGGPTALIAAMRKIQSQVSGAPCSISQAAAACALAKGKDADVTRMLAAFSKRRSRFGQAINAIPGLSVDLPDGAFYFFVSVENLIGMSRPDGAEIQSEHDMVDYFLKHANVGTVTGRAFGLQGYIRLSFAAADADLEEAVARLSKAVSLLS